MINAALAKNVLDDLMVTNTRGAMQALHVLDIGGIDDTAACIVAPPDLWDRRGRIQFQVARIGDKRLITTLLTRSRQPT